DGGGCLAQPGGTGGGVVGRDRLAEQGQLALQRVHLVEGAHDRVDEIGIVDPVGDRLGEGQPDPGEDVAVGGGHLPSPGGAGYAPTLWGGRRRGNGAARPPCATGVGPAPWA